MPSSWSRFFRQSRQQTEAALRSRQRRVLDQAGLIDFGSNDYLGLRDHPSVLSALRADDPGLAWGAGASPVLSGYSQQHAVLEQSLARFSQTPSAIVFSSGYACHVGTIACLAAADDLILSDQLNHASLIDGCRLSRATTRVYPHCDLDFVRDFLSHQRHRFGKVLLLSESIFGMDGDAAPLPELCALAEQFDVGLVVDEAHAVGVYGENGSGLLEEWQLQSRALAKLGTLSKALGGVGGYVAADSAVIEYLVNRCRSYLFSTAAPPRSLAAAAAALELVIGLQAARGELRHRARSLRERLQQLGLALPQGDCPIVPVVVGSESRVLQLAQQLSQAGLYVPAIRPPTVPEGTCRLRISLSLRHTPEQIEHLVATLSACL